MVRQSFKWRGSVTSRIDEKSQSWCRKFRFFRLFKKFNSMRFCIFPVFSNLAPVFIFFFFYSSFKIRHEIAFTVLTILTVRKLKAINQNSFEVTTTLKKRLNYYQPRFFYFPLKNFKVKKIKTLLVIKSQKKKMILF